MRVEIEVSLLFRRHYFFEFRYVDRATVDADWINDSCLKSSVAVLAQECCPNLRVVFKNVRAVITQSISSRELCLTLRTFSNVTSSGTWGAHMRLENDCHSRDTSVLAVASSIRQIQTLNQTEHEK
jgi:hypothetical protein